MPGKEGSANGITVGQNVHFYSLSCPNAYGDISKGFGLIKIKIKGDKSNWKKTAENNGVDGAAICIKSCTCMLRKRSQPGFILFDY